VRKESDDRSLEEKIGQARKRLRNFEKAISGMDTVTTLQTMGDYLRAQTDLTELLEAKHARQWRLLLFALPELEIEAGLSHLPT
jgi:hypothetical protein